MIRWAALVLVALFIPGSQANHATPCIVTSADPRTINTVVIPWTPLAPSRTYYDEERGNPFGVPIPGSGFVFGPDNNNDGVPELFEGEGTWVYREANAIEGLQRGACGPGGIIDGRQMDDCQLGDWFPPGCDQNPDWDPTQGTYPCIFIDEDPIDDETCHAGPDALILF